MAAAGFYAGIRDQQDVVFEVDSGNREFDGAISPVLIFHFGGIVNRRDISLTFIAVLNFLLAGCATEGPLVAKIQWAGTYTVAQSSRVDDPSRLTGKRTIASGVHPDVETTQIKAALGTTFGYQFFLFGPAPAKAMEVQIIIRYPKPGLTNPVTGESRAFFTKQSICYVGLPCYVSFVFSDSWELVPGPWILEVLFAGQRLVAERFDVSS